MHTHTDVIADEILDVRRQKEKENIKTQETGILLRIWTGHATYATPSMFWSVPSLFSTPTIITIPAAVYNFKQFSESTCDSETKMTELYTAVLYF